MARWASTMSKSIAAWSGGRVGGAGEEVGFEERDAVEAPGGVGEFLDELGFGGGGGLVFVEELLAVALVGGGVFGGQDGGAAGEAVAEGVERGALFAGFGARAGGVLGVGAVGASAAAGIGVARLVDIRNGPFDVQIAWGRMGQRGGGGEVVER